MTRNADSALTSDSTSPSSGWWKEYLEAIPDGYLDVVGAEEDASRITHFHPTFVPGLLQTEKYAVAITPITTLKTMTPSEAARLVEVRMLRQRAALNGPRPKELVFLMDESALRRPVGEPAVMREQLDHLLAMAVHPAVTLVVIPFRARPHPGLLGAFTVLRYEGGIADVLCFEWQLGNVVIRDQPELVRKYTDLAGELAGRDPYGDLARRLIGSALDELAKI